MRLRGEHPSGTGAADRKVLWVLRKRGAQSMEDLTMLTGMGSEQIFFSVDRLSRSGKIILAHSTLCGYRVSIGPRGY